MCVLQCSCGMVVSTRGTQARCIRCGAILGPCDAFEIRTELPRGDREATEQEESDQDTVEPDARADRRHEALAAYVSLVIISAARGAVGAWRKRMRRQAAQGRRWRPWRGRDREEICGRVSIARVLFCTHQPSQWRGRGRVEAVRAADILLCAPPW